MLERIHPDDRQKVRSAIEACRASVIQIEFRVSDTRSCSWIELRGRTLARTGTDFVCGGAFIDITERKLTQARLTQSHIKLQRELTVRRDEAGKVAHGKEEWIRASLELDQFCDLVSHDLQEPLRTISSYMQLLSRRTPSLDPEAKKFIQFALSGAKRMSVRLRELLAYSRLNRLSLEWNEIDSQVLVEDVLRRLGPLLEQNQAQIAFTALPTVYGHPAQLARLIEELIRNAIRYRREQVPRVEISAQELTSEWLFRIRDNGLGIPAKCYDRIFMVFQHGELGRDRAGIGMGLAACKRIVENHGGRIGVESTVGEGSTFYFTLAKRPVFID